MEDKGENADSGAHEESSVCSRDSRRCEERSSQPLSLSISFTESNERETIENIETGERQEKSSSDEKNSLSEVGSMLIIREEAASVLFFL